MVKFFNIKSCGIYVESARARMYHFDFLIFYFKFVINDYKFSYISY